jgi:hypothetical protein
MGLCVGNPPTHTFKIGLAYKFITVKGIGLCAGKLTTSPPSPPLLHPELAEGSKLHPHL